VEREEQARGMKSTGTSVWEGLMSQLRSIARARTVKPKTSGLKCRGPNPFGDFIWKGINKNLSPHLLPPNYIELRLSQEGDIIHYSISIHTIEIGQCLLSKPADTSNLESLVEHLSELAQQI